MKSEAWFVWLESVLWTYGKYQSEIAKIAYELTRADVMQIADSHVKKEAPLLNSNDIVRYLQQLADTIELCNELIVNGDATNVTAALEICMNIEKR